MTIYSPEYETMPRREIEQLQIERLQTTINRVYRNVAFYKRVFDEQRIDVERIRGIEDVRRLPFTTKEDLRSAYPYGMFAVPLRDIVRVHATSGTTGKAVVVGYTRNDIRRWSELVARLLSAAGITDHDFVQIAFGYGLFTGGLGFHYGAEKIGASVIPSSSVARLEEQVIVMRDYKTTALISLPSYGLTVANALEGLGIHPDALFLKVGIFGAEPWSESVRRQIEEKLRIKAFDNYGLSEIMGPGVSAECVQREGLHLQEDHFIAEVIDPRSGEVLPCGSEGELVLTTITKEGFPLIRYRTGDLTTLSTAPCPCGRTFARMSRTAGRTDDLIITRGIKFFPSQIEALLMQIGGVAPHLQIVLTSAGGVDEMELKVEISEQLGFDEIRSLETFRSKIAAGVERALGLVPRVTLVEPRSLRAGADKKVKRFVDKRNS